MYFVIAQNKFPHIPKAGKRFHIIDRRFALAVPRNEYDITDIIAIHMTQHLDGRYEKVEAFAGGIGSLIMVVTMLPVVYWKVNTK